MPADGSILTYSSELGRGHWAGADGVGGGAIARDYDPFGENAHVELHMASDVTGGSFELGIDKDGVQVAATVPLGHDVGGSDIQTAIGAALTAEGIGVPSMDSASGNFPADVMTVDFLDGGDWDLHVAAASLTGSGASPALVIERQYRATEQEPVGTTWVNTDSGQAWIQTGAGVADQWDVITE